MSNRGGKRDGAGRPSSNKTYISTSIRLDEQAHNIIKQHAQIAQCSMASLLQSSVLFGEMRAYAHMLSRKKKTDTQQNRQANR